MQNLISAKLADSDYQDVLLAIKIIKDKLPFLMRLSEDEKQNIPQMEDSKEAFVSKALSYGEDMPSLLPSLVDIAEFKRDMKLYSQIYQIFKELNSLHELVDDTKVAVSSDAYSVAQVIFNIAKMGARFGKPSAELNEIVFELEKLSKA